MWGRSPSLTPSDERVPTRTLPVLEDMVCCEGVLSSIVERGVLELGTGMDRYDVEEEADDAVPMVDGGMVDEPEAVEPC
jgi:hypothetical protein